MAERGYFMRKTVLKNKLVPVMMAASMAVSAMAPMTSFAAERIETSAEAVTYYDEAGTAESATGDEFFDATGAFDETISKETKVVVAQEATLAVKVPYKIVLNGTKDEANDATYDVQVKGDISGTDQVNVVPNTAHYASLADKKAGQNLVADNFADGSGTFAMLEAAGVKNNITATIEQADTSWTMADDGTTSGAQMIDDADGKGIKHGTVSVADLSAGEWSNDIAFDISITEIQ